MKMTKKFFKTTEQRNVELDTQFYDQDEIEKMAKDSPNLVFFTQMDEDHEDPRVALQAVDKIEVTFDPVWDCLVAVATPIESDEKLYVKF